DRAPLGLAALTAVALVIAPGLAVDAAGTRLGQGGGSYDRALPRLRPGTPIVVTLHPGEEAVEPLPVEAHDRPADGVITAEGMRWISPSTT
uniref:5-formyltetrahydrofolate cyclo-ligase n=1 Tax=Kribbia dieselivorans TaxID=331526 RepID=UPI000B0B88E3